MCFFFFFFSSRRRHTRWPRDWSSDVCSSDLDLNNFKEEDKKIPYRVLKEFKGSELVGAKYEQLLPWALPYENADQAFRVISGDFVTTEDGTGIVHTARTVGADDAQVATEKGVRRLQVM